MKNIERIKEQVSAIVVFKSESFEQLREEYYDVTARIEDGLDRMKELNVFSDDEVKQVRDYAYELRHRRYHECNRDIAAALRGSFEF